MASEDIAPKLIAGVRKEFQRNCLKDVEMRKLSEKAGNGEATYADAYRYAEAVGTARADAFGSVISSDVLPDGKMYYNIAERLMTDSLTTDHNMVADFSEMVQQAINDNRIGIDMKAQKADLNEDRIDGFVQRLASEDKYDDVAWITQEPVRTHARSVVDDTIKKNAEFQHKAGIKVSVKRDAAGDCCKWCDSLIGEYTYPGVPRDVFARHDNCRCTLDYNGRRLTAYESKTGSHSFRDQGEQERIEARKEYAAGVENKNELLKLARQGNTYVVKSDKLYEYSQKIKPIDDYTDIVGHGDPYSMVFKDATGKETNVSAKEFGDIIEKGGFYNGGKIRLIACQTGAGNGVVPTYLAKRFNTEVLAPTEIVNVDFEGNMILADNDADAKMKIETGVWALFGPNGRIK